MTNQPHPRALLPIGMIVMLVVAICLVASSLTAQLMLVVADWLKQNMK